MPSNIAVKITADVVDLQVKYAIASASTRSLSSELNSLAKQAVAAGGEMSAELKASLTQVAESTVKAKAGMNALKAEMNAGKEASRAAAESMGLLKEAMGAFGVVASVGAVVEFGKAIFENAANIQRQAEALGISTDQLQAFQYAARASGVETDAASAALTKFYSGLGQAYEGTGPALRALQDLGLNVGRLATDQENASATVARALLAETNQYERNAHIRELFGKSGQDMNAMLEQLAQGFDANLDAAKRNGEYLDNNSTKAALDAAKQFEQAKTQLEVGLTPAVIFLTHSLTGLVEMFRFVASTAQGAGSGISLIGTTALAAIPGVGQLAMMLDLINQKKSQTSGSMTAEPAKPYNARHDAAEKVDVAGLDALDSKLRERKVLLGEIKTATDTLHEAQGAHDKDGIAAAQTVISDLNKQLEALNKVKNTSGFANAGAEAISDAQVKLSGISGDPTKSAQERKAAEDAIYDELLQDARLNAAQINEVTKEKNRADIASEREAATEKRQIDQSNTQTALELAKIGLEQEKSILEEEVADGTISKKQELSQLITILEAERDAKLEAIKDAEQGYATESTFFIEKENEKKTIVAQTEADIAAIRRQMAQESANQQLATDKAMYSQLASAEGTFVSDMFAGRLGLYGSLRAIGLQFVEKEITDDLRYFTAHALLSQAELVKDKGIAQEGILFHAFSENAKTSATVTGNAVRTASDTGAATASGSVSARSYIAAIEGDAAKAYADVFAYLSPEMGPFAAIPAAAAFALVAAKTALVPSFAVGAYDLPRDTFAQLHAGEMVIPKTFATGLRENISGGGTNVFGGNTSNASANTTHNWNINYNANGGGDHRANARDIVDIIKHQTRIGRI